MIKLDEMLLRTLPLSYHEDRSKMGTVDKNMYGIQFNRLVCLINSIFYPSIFLPSLIKWSVTAIVKSNPPWSLKLKGGH